MDLDGVGTGECAACFDDFDSGVFEYKVLIDVVESRDFLNDGW